MITEVAFNLGQLLHASLLFGYVGRAGCLMTESSVVLLPAFGCVLRQNTKTLNSDHSKCIEQQLVCL